MVNKMNVSFHRHGDFVNGQVKSGEFDDKLAVAVELLRLLRKESGGQRRIIEMRSVVTAGAILFSFPGEPHSRQR